MICGPDEHVYVQCGKTELVDRVSGEGGREEGREGSDIASSVPTVRPSYGYTHHVHEAIHPSKEAVPKPDRLLDLWANRW